MQNMNDLPSDPSAPPNPVTTALSGSAALGFALPAGRETVSRLSMTAQKAMIAPQDPGGWPISWRCAAAARVARLHDNAALAEAYGQLVTDPADEPVRDGCMAGRDVREAVALAFLDAVSTCPRDVRVEEVEALKAAGVTEADIVRLCELAAFLAYHCRVADVLARLKGVAA